MRENFRDNFETITLWRGMRDIEVTDDYMASGGAELACLSTSPNRAVVASYARSACPLIFKIEVDSHMAMGADISFLSLFPGEQEYLYPPLTYLQPTSQVDLINSKEEKVGVQVTVVPSFPAIDLDS